MAKSVDGANKGADKGPEKDSKDPKDPKESAPAPTKRHRLRVLVIRHGIAEDRVAFARAGRADAARPLTKAGRRKMRQVARGLAGVVPRVDRIATSPLARAVETGDIVAAEYGKARGKSRPHRLGPLAPGKPLNGVLAWLQDQPAGATVALVGHEPDLGVFISWALTGLRESFVPLKKGGACLLAFAGEIKPGRAALLWLLRPSQLRDLGGK